MLVFLVISGFGLSGYVYYDKTQLESYLNTEIDSLNSIIATKDDIILEKNVMIAGLESHKEDLEEQIKELNTEISSINSTLNRVSLERLELEIQMSLKESEYDILQSQKTYLQNTYDSLKEEHENLQSQYDEIQSSYSNLLNKYELLVGALPLSPEPLSTETIDVEYNWYYQGSYWTLSLSIPDSLYKHYKNKERAPTEDYSIYVTHPYDDEYLNAIIQKIIFIALSKSYTESEKINLVIAFVQSLPYTSDNVTTSYDEYPRYPLETLVDNGGDCEDAAILTAALLESLNYDSVLLGFPGHIAVGVAIDTSGSYYLYDNQKYFYLETTGEGWQIGEKPEDFKDMSATIYPLNPIPVLTHEWTTDWRLIRQEWKLVLNVTVKNLGTASASDIRVYAAFDQEEEGFVWNPEESDAFDLYFGRETSIELILEAPKNVYTRLIVGVLDSEGYLVDVSYSEWFDID